MMNSEIGNGPKSRAVTRMALIMRTKITVKLCQFPSALPLSKVFLATIITNSCFFSLVLISVKYLTFMKLPSNVSIRNMIMDSSNNMATNQDQICHSKGPFSFISIITSLPLISCSHIEPTQLIGLVGAIEAFENANPRYGASHSSF